MTTKQFNSVASHVDTLIKNKVVNIITPHHYGEIEAEVTFYLSPFDFIEVCKSRLRVHKNKLIYRRRWLWAEGHWNYLTDEP